MSFRLRACAAAVLVAFSVTPSLARDVFECSFPETASNMGYLPQTVVLARETGADTVTIVDPFIQAMEGGPIDKKIVDESDAKLSVSWVLNLKSTGNDYVKVHYRLSIQKGSLKTSLTGRPMNYSNTFSAQGKCKRLKA